MMVIPILEPALRDFAGALAVSTIKPNDRRFRTTVYSLAVTHWACDRYVIKIVCRLVHLKAANDETKEKTHRSRIIAATPTQSWAFAASQLARNERIQARPQIYMMLPPVTDLCLCNFDQRCAVSGGTKQLPPWIRERETRANNTKPIWQHCRRSHL